MERASRFSEQNEESKAISDILGYDPIHRSSITTRVNHYKFATREDLHHALHSHKLDRTMAVRLMREYMRPSARQRFDEVAGFLMQPKSAAPTEVLPSPMLNAQHAQKLVDDGIAVRVTDDDLAQRPTMGAMKVLLVLEDKVDDSGNASQRLRVCHWPKEQNASIKGDYKAQLPLGHIGEYVHIASADCAATLDLKCGFWQMPLPRASRHFYRYRDADGVLYEMTRIMMGHSVSVELMQLLAGVVFGDPDVVQHQYRSPAPVRIWVDGAIFYGTRELVAESVAMSKRNAQLFSAVFKDGNDAPSKHVTFIGAEWNFDNHTVRLAKKTRSKLPHVLRTSMSAKDVEQLVGRLIFAGGLLQLPLAEFYWALKWAKRACNGINNGRLQPDQPVDVPRSVYPQLRRWLSAAHNAAKPRIVDASTERPCLFADATLKTWGGVLALPTGQVLLTGGKFLDDVEPIIAVREAQAALYAFQDFREALRQYKAVNLIIDNTTAEQSICKGKSSCAQLALVVRDMLRESIDMDVAIIVSRVKSADNPADEPSRELDFNIDKLRAALATRVPNYARSGAGRSYLLVKMSPLS